MDKACEVNDIMCFHLFLLHQTRKNKVHIKKEIFFSLDAIMTHDDDPLLHSSRKDQKMHQVWSIIKGQWTNNLEN
jgi:hypothetical protein